MRFVLSDLFCVHERDFVAGFQIGLWMTFMRTASHTRNPKLRVKHTCCVSTSNKAKYKYKSVVPKKSTIRAPVGMGVSHSLHSQFGGFFRHIENRLDVETMQAKHDLEAHFSSVQRICDEIALPSISPRIKYALQSRLNLATQLEILRAPANGTTSPHMKLKAWEELKVLSFTRAAAATLSLTIVNLQMRVMLDVLSRQLYLEHALSGTPGREGLPSLSVDAQEAFLGLVETGFASTGIGGNDKRCQEGGWLQSCRLATRKVSGCLGAQRATGEYSK